MFLLLSAEFPYNIRLSHCEDSLSISTSIFVYTLNIVPIKLKSHPDLSGVTDYGAVAREDEAFSEGIE